MTPAAPSSRTLRNTSFTRMPMWTFSGSQSTIWAHSLTPSSISMSPTTYGICVSKPRGASWTTENVNTVPWPLSCSGVILPMDFRPQLSQTTRGGKNTFSHTPHLLPSPLYRDDFSRQNRAPAIALPLRLQQVHDARPAGAAHVVRESNLRAFYLARARLAPQLRDNLNGLRNAGRAQRVAARL